MVPERIAARLRDRAETILGDSGPPGAVLAVVVDGDLWSEGIGSRDLERSQPLAADSLLPIYSVTKPMVAAIVLKLAEQRALRLDQPVVSVLAGIPLSPELTVRHLLNHTGGLADYGGMPEYVADLKRDPAMPWTEQTFLDRVLGQGMQYVPGQGWAYANVGYLLLRRIVEQITGRSLSQMLADELFQPLGLRQAQLVEDLNDTSVLTPGYSTLLSGDGSLADVAPRYHPGWVSHGLVAATAAEVAIFLDRLLTGGVVGPALKAEMLQGVDVPATHPLFARPTYGLGLMVDPASKYGLAAGHGGSGPGYAAGAFHFANVGGRRVTSVALVNGDERAWGEEIAFALADEVAASLDG